LPPKLAPIQVVIIPIYKKAEQLKAISEIAGRMAAELKTKGISVKYDDSDNKKPGWKFAEYELKGVPLRLVMGPRDLENGTIEVVRRDTMQKEVATTEGIVSHVEKLLIEIQKNIFDKALAFREKNTRNVDTYEEFKEVLRTKGGFIRAHWDGTSETENKIKEETKATIRCLPLDKKKEKGKCIYSGKPSDQRVIFALAY